MTDDLLGDVQDQPAAAKAMAPDLAALQPAHKAYFQVNLAKFDASLTSWLTAIAQFKSQHAGTPVAVTEPVADCTRAARARRPQPDHLRGPAGPQG